MKRGSRTVDLIVGCPGAGKTWVAERLKDRYELVHHDACAGMSGKRYVNAIKAAAASATKPILAEAPFSVSQIRRPLEAAGYDVRPVYIQEKRNVIAQRYQSREGKPIPQGHLTRQDTYREMADSSGAFAGTNREVLGHLKRLNRGMKRG
jgi:TPP-dependent 2-oxoacid decarboxylase